MQGLSEHHAEPGAWLRLYWPVLVAVAGAVVVVLVVMLANQLGQGQTP